MGLMLRQFILAVGALSSCEGFFRSHQHHKRRSDIVFVAAVDTDDVRHKRSVAMPDTLRFRFVTRGMDLEVRIRRSVKDKPDVTSFPLFVIENGTITRRYLSPLQTAAIYSNDTQGHMFIVRRALDRAEFILEGVLWDGLQQYHIMPDHDALHRIYKLERLVDFRGDYIENTVTASRTKDAPTRQTRLRRRAEQSKQDFISRGTNRTAGRPWRSHWLNRWVEGRETNIKRRRKQLKTGKSQIKERDKMESEKEEWKNLENSADGWKPSRGKRQVASDYEIEIFLVADFRDYSGWLDYYGGNTTRTEVEMNLYYALVANSISQRYRSITHVDPNLKIDIIITGLLIVNSRDDSYWTENHVLSPGSSYVEASDALESFRTWVRNARANLPASDHWMLFTGYDIYTDKNPNIAGLAKLGGLCSYLSVSIIEQDNTASVGATAAHELGHSLSARHDGEEKDCRDEDNFIMSRKLKTPDLEKLASRPWQFSPCSVKAFREFLSQVKCGQRGPARGSALVTDLGGGQVFSADLQCQLALGKRSYFGRSLQSAESYTSMCRRLYCAVPGEPGLFQAIFAMEKTTCGDGKWCVQGKCSADVRAPRVTDICPQGDDPAAPCAEEDCQYYTPRTRDIYCCYTCRQAVNREIILSPSNVPILLAQKERILSALAASSNMSAVPSNQSANVTNATTPAQAPTDVPSSNGAGVSTNFSSLNSTSTTPSTSPSPSMPTPPEDVGSTHYTASISRQQALSVTESAAAATSAWTSESAATKAPAALSGSMPLSNSSDNKTSPETSWNPAVLGTTVGYMSGTTQTASDLASLMVRGVLPAGPAADEHTSRPPPQPQSLDSASVADTVSVTLPTRGSSREVFLPANTAHTPDRHLSDSSNSLNSTVTSDHPQAVPLNELHAKLSLGEMQSGRAARVLHLPYTEGDQNTTDSAAGLYTTHSPIDPATTHSTTNKQTTHSTTDPGIPKTRSDAGVPTGTSTVYLITTEKHTTFSTIDPQHAVDQHTTQSVSDIHTEYTAVSSHITYSSTVTGSLYSTINPRPAYEVIGLTSPYLRNEARGIGSRTERHATASAMPSDAQSFRSLLELVTQVPTDHPSASQSSDTRTSHSTAMTTQPAAGVSVSVSSSVSSNAHRLPWTSKDGSSALGDVSTLTQPTTSAPLNAAVQTTQPSSQAPINETDPLSKSLSPNRDGASQLPAENMTSRVESKGTVGERDSVLATRESGDSVLHLPETGLSAAASEEVGSESRVGEVRSTSPRTPKHSVTAASRDVQREAAVSFVDVGLGNTERVAEIANTKQTPVPASSLDKKDVLLPPGRIFSNAIGGTDISVSFSLFTAPEPGTAQAQGHITSGLPLETETPQAVTERRTFPTNKQAPQATSYQLVHTADVINV